MSLIHEVFLFVSLLSVCCSTSPPRPLPCPFASDLTCSSVCLVCLLLAYLPAVCLPILAALLAVFCVVVSCLHYPPTPSPSALCGPLVSHAHVFCLSLYRFHPCSCVLSSSYVRCRCYRSRLSQPTIHILALPAPTHSQTLVAPRSLGLQSRGSAAAQRRTRSAPTQRPRRGSLQTSAGHMCHLTLGCGLRSPRPGRWPAGQSGSLRRNNQLPCWGTRPERPKNPRLPAHSRRCIRSILQRAKIDSYQKVGLPALVCRLPASLPPRSASASGKLSRLMVPSRSSWAMSRSISGPICGVQ